MNNGVAPGDTNGYGFRSSAICTIGYIHAYSNQLANILLAATTRADLLEVRDGKEMGLSIIAGGR